MTEFAETTAEKPLRPGELELQMIDTMRAFLDELRQVKTDLAMLRRRVDAHDALDPAETPSQRAERALPEQQHSTREAQLPCCGAKACAPSPLLSPMSPGRVERIQQDMRRAMIALTLFGLAVALGVSAVSKF
jgi:hypothetical protein